MSSPSPHVARRTSLFAAAALAAVVLADGRAARADAAPAPVDLTALLARLEHHAAQIEQMKRLASYTVRGHIDELDGDGHVSHAKDIVAAVTATGGDPRFDIMRFVDDGVDKTADAQQRARERRAKPRTGERRDFHMPFLASEQARYSFGIAERVGGRVRVSFAPKVAAEDAFKGSAWVDADAGEVLTMGLSPTKNPSFIDHVDVTVTFDTRTPIGRAPSSIAFDARGGFLFVHKRYRGRATLEDARVAAP